MLFKMLSIEWSSHQLSSSSLGDPSIPRPRQLFVTKSRTLADKVEEEFQGYFRSMEAATLSPQELKAFAAREKAKRNGIQKSEGEEAALVDRDDLQDWKINLPKKFSLLREEHFPLFITYDGVRIDQTPRICLLLMGFVCSCVL